MRKPITKIEKELVRNFEHIVVDEVNKLDPIGLLAMDCPNDEYKSEIRDITLRLSRPMNWLELSEVMYVVFAYKFDLAEAKPESKYLEPAKNICKRILEMADGK